MKTKPIPPKLRVMAEYGSSGIWVIGAVGPFGHGMISHEALGLSSDLSRRFDDWVEMYLDWITKGELDVERFNATGRILAKELKQAVGPNTYVEFVPESQDGSLGDPEIV